VSQNISSLCVVDRSFAYISHLRDREGGGGGANSTDSKQYLLNLLFHERHFTVKNLCFFIYLIINLFILIKVEVGVAVAGGALGIAGQSIRFTFQYLSKIPNSFLPDVSLLQYIQIFFNIVIFNNVWT
jgi:hypothetical protein